jgi:hypothetical protein
MIRLQRVDPLQMLGAITAMVGATLIATKLNVYVGFWHFLVSSLLLTWWAAIYRLRWIMYMQIVFTVINIVGIARWE